MSHPPCHTKAKNYENLCIYHRATNIHSAPNERRRSPFTTHHSQLTTLAPPSTLVRRPSSPRPPRPTSPPLRHPAALGRRNPRPLDPPHLRLPPPRRHHLPRHRVPRKTLRQNHPPHRPQRT